MTSLFTGARPDVALEARVARLEDIQAIHNLKATYAHLCDSGYDADQLAQLFVEEAVWKSNLFGPFVGREAIRDYFRELAEGEIRWALHCMIAPVIEVDEDGESATGIWYLVDLATFGRPGGTDADAVLVTATYRDSFVKRRGEWRFLEVAAQFHQVSDWDKGWVKQRFRADVVAADSERGSS